jgi:hypothetical protein
MTEPEKPLFEQEFEVFNANLPDWLARGLGGYALIRGTEVRGPYETQNDAINIGYETFGNVPFLVEPVVDKKPTVTLHEITSDQGGVPLPGKRVSGTLAEVFGFTIDDEARELYASNMRAIEDGRREADRIIRTL